MPGTYDQATARGLAFLMMAGVLALAWGFFGYLGDLSLGPAALLVVGGGAALGYGLWKSPRGR